MRGLRFVREEQGIPGGLPRRRCGARSGWRSGKEVGEQVGGESEAASVGEERGLHTASGNIVIGRILRLVSVERAESKSIGRPRLSIWPMGADTLSRGMTDRDANPLAASTDVSDAISTPTAIDEEEFAEARLDERWREFCVNAEQYVAETTRPRPRVQQPA